MQNYNVTYSSEQQKNQSPPNAIYIDDNPVAGDLLHVKLDCLATQKTSLTLKGQSNQKASADNYHFDVFFRPGELANPAGIALATDQTKDWDIFVDNAPDGTDIYFLHKGALTLQPGQSCTVTLQKVGANAKNGQRSTSVQLSFNDENAAAYVSPADLDPLNSTVEIVNFTRKPTPPLSVSFETTNMVLCDGSAKNALVLRIVNQGLFDIDLDPAQCSFTLSFDADTDVSLRWALAKPDQVSSFYIPGKLDSSGPDSNWVGHGAWDLEKVKDPLEWKLTPKSSTTVLGVGKDAAIEIPISNIVTGHAVGRALLHVDYQGLHGYADGQFTVEIEKTPLLYLKGKVGIGTTSPSRPLQVKTGSGEFGVSHTDGTVELATYINGIGAWLGTPSNHPLQFYTNNSSDPRLTLTTDGKLGVGTTSPGRPLQVKTGSGEFGVSHTDGTVELATYVNNLGGWLGTHSNHSLQFYTNNSQPQATLTTDGKLGIGTTSPGAKLDVQGDVAFSGKLGIGTTSPGRPLQVKTGSGEFGVSHTDGTVELATYVNDDHGGWLGTHSNHALNFYTNNSQPQVTLKTGGNLGIGTTDPKERLHVNGDLRVDGGINVNGHKAMEFRKFSTQNDWLVSTGYSSKDWVACIVGWDAGQIPLGKTIEFKMSTSSSSSEWAIQASVDTGDKSYGASVWVLFIRRELFGQVDVLLSFESRRSRRRAGERGYGSSER